MRLWLQKLPHINYAFYFLMRGDECLYVGKSINLRNRWSANEKLSEVESSEGLHLAWQPTPESNLDAIERKMIVALKPKYNYNLVPRPPVSRDNREGGGEDSAMRDLITQAEAAELMRRSLSAVNDLVRRGRLRSVEMFGRRLVYRAEVEAFQRDARGRKTSN